MISSTADQMFLDIKPDMQSKMPVYKGDLELINHSAGSLTSQAYHKRWNRRNEILADAAEKASIAAAWMGGRPYPQQRLNDAWTLVMGGQFHDPAPAQRLPAPTRFAWNDDVIALNQFAEVLTSATQAVASALDTQVRGMPVVVYNSLNIRSRGCRRSCDAHFPGEMPTSIRVFGPDGREVPSQVSNGERCCSWPRRHLSATRSTTSAVHKLLRSAELKISKFYARKCSLSCIINANGNVTSIFDKTLNKELLSVPMRLAISNDAPRNVSGVEYGI